MIREKSVDSFTPGHSPQLPVRSKTHRGELGPQLPRNACEWSCGDASDIDGQSREAATSGSE